MFESHSSCIDMLLEIILGFFFIFFLDNIVTIQVRWAMDMENRSRSPIIPCITTTSSSRSWPSTREDWDRLDNSYRSLDAFRLQLGLKDPWIRNYVYLYDKEYPHVRGQWAHFKRLILPGWKVCHFSVK